MNGKRIIFLATLGLGLVGATAPPSRQRERTILKTSNYSGDAKIVHLSNKDVATIYIHPGGSVLSFPAKPSKVVLGREGQFDVQYIEHDVAVVALSQGANASMFVYLLGRRYAFNLVTAVGKGERIIVIRDPYDDRIEIEVK
ncbi:MAG: hypothetical protein NTV34_17790 [Proteobacteria bacterium]|nr:hypothetical protein [Pseudomonadota bacterium]